MPAIDTATMMPGFNAASQVGPLNDPSIFRQDLTDPRGERFDSALRRALGGDQKTQQTPRQAAEEFISMALVQPILAQLRETNQAAGPFAPGEAEKSFGPMLDAEIAHQMVKSSGWGLISAVTSRLEAHSATANRQGVNANA